MSLPGWWNLPNAISLLRIPLAAAFVFAGTITARFVIVVAAAFSDWVDGRLARGTGRTTRAGELLDPVADRTFMATALIVLVVEGFIPAWTLPLLLLRDIGVVLGGMVVFARNPRARLPARTAGKSVTWLQFIATAAIILRPSLALWIAPLIALLGAFALQDYARAALTQLRTRPAGNARGD